MRTWVRGEEEAFRVVAEYNRLGGDYAPDPEQPASESQPSQPTDGAPLEEAAVTKAKARGKARGSQISLCNRRVAKATASMKLASRHIAMPWKF